MEHIRNFLTYNFYHINGVNNRYLSAHIVGFIGAFWLIQYFGWNYYLTLFYVLLGAIAWELKEFIIDYKMDWIRVQLEYRRINFYWYDTVGDVLIPLVLVLVML